MLPPVKEVLPFWRRGDKSLSRLRRRLDTWMSFIVLVANSIYFIYHCRLISVECRLHPIFITTYVRESILQVMLINIILQLGLCCFLFLLSSTLSCSPLHPTDTFTHTLSLFLIPCPTIILVRLLSPSLSLVRMVAS